MQIYFIVHAKNPGVLLSVLKAIPLNTKFYHLSLQAPAFILFCVFFCPIILSSLLPRGPYFIRVPVSCLDLSYSQRPCSAIG